MYTSERKLLGNVLMMLGCSLFLALFGAIYEHFSHQVYSYFMLYAFALPLALGALPWALALRYGKRVRAGVPALWDAAVLTLTVGSVLRGVLDIYGTTSRLLIAYPVAAAVLALCACWVLLRPTGSGGGPSPRRHRQLPAGPAFQPPWNGGAGSRQ